MDCVIHSLTDSQKDEMLPLLLPLERGKNKLGHLQKPLAFEGII